MSTNIGVWIDHRKAVIVTISDNGETIKEIPSNVEKHRGRTGGIPEIGSYESQNVPASDRQQREFTGHLNVFYDEVVASIKDAESILIMGPGEAKGELKKRIEKNNSRVAGVVTVDKLTAVQIAAKVRAYFQDLIKQA